MREYLKNRFNWEMFFAIEIVILFGITQNVSIANFKDAMIVFALATIFLSLPISALTK
jgi:hypothetical protein